MNACDPQCGDIVDVPQLVVEEQHLLVRQACLLMEPLEVCNFAAWVDFLIREVFVPVKDCDQLPRCIRIISSRSQSEEVALRSQTFQHSRHVGKHVDSLAVAIVDFPGSFFSEWRGHMRINVEGPQRVVQIKNY